VTNVDTQTLMGLARRCEERAAELVEAYFDRVEVEPRAAVSTQWQLDEAHNLIDLALAFGEAAERIEPTKPQRVPAYQ
jgi:hypothetical protein